jgi:hypothetical protein
MIKLETLVQYFDDAEDASTDARTSSELCRDYYDGNQWTAAEIAALKKRNQPPIVFNLIQPKVDWMKGHEQQSRTDPKAYPRTPDHDEAADAATDGIRYVLDNNNFDEIASDEFEHLIIEGTEGVSVEVSQGAKDIDINVIPLAWNRLFIDPHSMKRDCSDARYMGYISWKDEAEVLETWPDSKAAIKEGMESYGKSIIGDSKDDKPNRWYSATRKRVMCVDIAFMYKGDWHSAIYAKGAFLEKPAKSTYVDEDGVPQCKFILASAYVDRDGQRYGPVKNDLDKQSETNKRRSKSLHLLNTRQTYSREGQIGDINKFKREANKPDGHLEYPGSGQFGKDFGIIPNEQLAGPQFDMYQEAKQSLDMSGANAALQGTADGMSGKAIRSLQAGGLLELTPLFDIHSQFKKRVYRAVWNRIRQYWREEKWIRVTDSDDNLQWVGLNTPMTEGEQLLKKQSGLSLSQIREQFAQELQQVYMQDPSYAQPVMENAVAEMDVDIIIEEVPDVINLQSEQFEMLVKMYQANPHSQENPTGIKWEHVVQMSTLRNKDQILGKDQTPEDQAAAEQQQQEFAEQKQIQQALISIDAENKQADTAVKRSRAQQTELESIVLMNSPDPSPQVNT